MSPVYHKIEAAGNGVGGCSGPVPIPRLARARPGWTYFVPGGLGVTTDTSRSGALGDLDGDGDLDALFGNAGTFLSGHGFLGGQNLYFMNNGQGLFIDRTKHVLPEVLDPTTDAEFGDVDGDGLLDIVVGNSGALERVLIQSDHP